jgi:hypothetical protein
MDELVAGKSITDAKFVTAPEIQAVSGTIFVILLKFTVSYYMLIMIRWKE